MPYGGYFCPRIYYNMAKITTKLPACSFVNDLPEVIISEVTSDALVTVTLNGTYLMSDVTLIPDVGGRIVVHVKEMTRNMLSLAKPSAQIVQLPMLRVEAVINGETFLTFGQVLPGGTTGLDSIDEEWFAKNFLTWQPQIIETTPKQPQWLAFVSSALHSSVEIFSALYTTTGQILSKKIDTIYQNPYRSYRQIRTDFEYLWETACEAKKLTPVCYDVYGNGFESNSSLATPNRPYAQRYILRSERYNDVCFGFENTLGGFDSLLLEGKQSYLPEGDTTTFKNYEEECELVNDYTSIWEANTGRLETERAATQFQDFLKSTNRYVFRSGTWCKIIVTEYKVKHYRGESNSYSFKYHLSEKNEYRFFERNELPEVELPTIL